MSAYGEQRWFALKVRPKHEKSSAVALRNKGYEEFVPLRRCRRAWSDRMKDLELPLFSGYIFCRFAPENRLPILTTPGVAFIVGVGKMPAPVADEEIRALQSVVRSGLEAEPWPYLRIGQRVRVQDGPLAGVEGILVGSRRGRRLVVSVTLLRRSVAVEVDANWLSPS